MYLNRIMIVSPVFWTDVSSRPMPLMSLSTFIGSVTVDSAARYPAVPRRAAKITAAKCRFDLEWNIEFI